MNLPIFSKQLLVNIKFLSNNQEQSHSFVKVTPKFLKNPANFPAIILQAVVV